MKFISDGRGEEGREKLHKSTLVHWVVVAF